MKIEPKAMTYDMLFKPLYCQNGRLWRPLLVREERLTNALQKLYSLVTKKMLTNYRFDGQNSRVYRIEFGSILG